jgi:1,4-dihydroxy-2-naphthoyl-CoA hydrolase
MSLLDKINANPLPFAKLLGIEFISVEADALAARMAIRPDLCTLGDICHGGAIMSFADTLGAAAAFVNLPPEAKGTTTIESKTNFVAAAPSGATVIGRTSLIHRGRRTQVWQTRSRPKTKR